MLQNSLGATLVVPVATVLAMLFVTAPILVQFSPATILQLQGEGSAAECSFDQDCQPGEICCDSTCLTAACKEDSGCDDSNSETADQCINPRDCNAYCTYTPTEVPPCTIACSSDAECDDLNVLTVDGCVNPAACDSYCLNTVIEVPPCAVACSSAVDCDDLNVLTVDE